MTTDYDGIFVEGLLGATGRALFEMAKRAAWRVMPPCPHGTPGGTLQNRCERCIREQKEIEERNRQEREIQERKRELEKREALIHLEADRLRECERLRLNKSFILNLDELRQLSPQDFEDEMARMFARMGYEVEQTPYSNDHGRDAILRKDGKKYLLECKRYGEGNPSGRPDLQKFHSPIMTEGAVFGFFVTTGRFTPDAIEFAKTVPIKLIDKNELVRMLFASKPAAANDYPYRSM
jgi:restriction endonuclease Mrr